MPRSRGAQARCEAQGEGGEALAVDIIDDYGERVGGGPPRGETGDFDAFGHPHHRVVMFAMNIGYSTSRCLTLAIIIGLCDGIPPPQSPRSCSRGSAPALGDRAGEGCKSWTLFSRYDGVAVRPSCPSYQPFDSSGLRALTKDLDQNTAKDSVAPLRLSNWSTVSDPKH